MSTDNGSFYAPNRSPTLADTVSSHSVNSQPQNSPHKQRRQRRYRVHGFPYVLATQKEQLSADVYARSLMLQGHGMALWSPSGDLPRSAEHITKGVGIGDVGTIDIGGNFVFMFNIFRKADDPIHRPAFIPREFQPIVLPLDSSEVSYTPDYFKPGTAIVSDGIRIKKHATDPSKMYFYCKAQEGAVLYLPHGASREDLIATDRLHQYIQHNAPHWYQKVNYYLSVGEYTNGSLMVVTGCDKASDWANAIFYGKGDIDYIRSQNFESYWCGDGQSKGQCYEPFSERLCGVKIPVGVDARHQCVFIRTIRVSLNSDLWINIMRNTITPPHYGTLTYRRSVFQRLSDAVTVWLKVFYEEEEALNIIMGRAIGHQVFHPNDILAQVLLGQFPNADTCLIADSTWSSCVDGRIGTVSSIDNLVDRVLIRHMAVVKHGCLSLIPLKWNSNGLRDLIQCYRTPLLLRQRSYVQIVRANRLKYGLIKQ